MKDHEARKVTFPSIDLLTLSRITVDLNVILRKYVPSLITIMEFHIVPKNGTKKSFAEYENILALLLIKVDQSLQLKH